MSTLLPPPKAEPVLLLAAPFAYVVTFALHGPPTAYQDFFQELEQRDAWMRYVANTWTVLTRLSLVDLADRLRQKIRTGDSLMVMPAKGPIDGWLPSDGWTWISKHVPREW